MITPRFHLSQDENSVTISIRAPYCSLSQLEIDVDEEVFLFSSKPYYLRLTLPGKIVEDERSKSSFDTDSGEFLFTYHKEQPGEYFKDLELITKLLTVKVDAHCEKGTIPIEVISEHDTEPGESIVSNPEFGYGFALRNSNDFMKVSSAFDDIFEVNPCEVSLKERRKLRIQYEQGKFNMDHYMADFIDNDQICEVISQKFSLGEKQDSSFSFTEMELDFLKDLPNKQYNLSMEQIAYCQNGLIDLLFAYCYDQRITEFEGNSESSWDINKLAATLCWFEGFAKPKAAIISAFRRSLIYPLYRHFELSQTVFNDLKTLISSNIKEIVRVLIKIYNIFLHGDRYIINQIFIKDYIIYVMKWDSDLWNKTVQEVTTLKVAKVDLGLNLMEIEDGFIPHCEFAALTINDDSDHDASDSDDYSSSDGSTDDSSSSDDSSECESCCGETIDGKHLIPH
ncbi:protein SHQ1 homolog [Dendroctonus ponderosae]